MKLYILRRLAIRIEQCRVTLLVGDFWRFEVAAYPASFAARVRAGKVSHEEECEARRSLVASAVALHAALQFAGCELSALEEWN